MAERKAGVLLHPTSLPGSGRHGTLGSAAYRFIDFIAEAGFKVWQMLPLSPPDEHGSPYQCESTRAGHTGLIDLELLVQWGWLKASCSDDWLAHAERFVESGADVELKSQYARFREQHADWLDDYALFVALKSRHAKTPWWQWEPRFRDREPDALRQLRQSDAAVLQRCIFEQFVFDRQWRALRDHAKSRHIELLGDMPIFVSADSVEVWAERECFQVDTEGRAQVVTGVPPDAYSATGQRWGSPHYDWDYIEHHDFDWWKRRLGFELDRFDQIRIDHFRGFVAAWEIPADCETAQVGHWRPAPGHALFAALRDDLGDLPLIAEDLGLITDEVHALRRRFALPGMRVLQFAFSGGADNPYLPHNHTADSVIYTGTHDNDTTLGWFQSITPDERTRVCAYLGADAADFPGAMIRTAFASVGDLAVIPMQDLLGLDGSHRMNTPGVAAGNWQWRFDWDQIDAALSGRIRESVQRYGR